MTQIPVYKEGDEIYLADTCRPLVDAARAGQLELAAIGRGGYPGRRLTPQLLPKLRSAGVWNAATTQNWGLPSHRNEGIELTFMATGEISITVEDEPRPLKHDHFLVTRPWQPHQLGDPNVAPGKLIWVIIDLDVRHPHQEWRWPDWIILSPEDVAELTMFLRQNERYVWPSTADIRRCFLGIAEALTVERLSSSASRAAVFINELLFQLLEMFRNCDVPLDTDLISTERSVQLFLEDLADDLEQQWTVEDMARSCDLGVTRFAHYCQKLTNMTPSKYLSHIRINAAAERLIRKPGEPITDIAFDCGFSSSQYFTNVFRRQMGCSPREYRNKKR